MAKPRNITGSDQGLDPASPAPSDKAEFEAVLDEAYGPAVTETGEPISPFPDASMAVRGGAVTIPKPRKVCFVGTTPTGGSAPYDDPSWEIWGVSGRMPWVKRATRWYEIHRLDGTFKTAPEADGWRATLMRQCADIPELRMVYPEPKLHPNVTILPAQRLEARFGGYWETSTFAWMWSDLLDEMSPGTGKALTSPPPGSRVMICGVEMEYGTEYSEQKAGMRHFINLAESHGWIVDRLAGSSFSNEPVPYPMWQDDPLLCKLEHLIERHRQVLCNKQAMLDQTREMLSHNRGQQACLLALRTLERTDEVWDKCLASLHNEEADLAKQSVSLCKDIVSAEAVKETHEWWRGWLKT